VEYIDNNPLFDFGNRFPLNLNNGVSLSRNMVNLTFKHLGFEEVTDLTPPVLEHWGWGYFYAKRTADVKSAYYA
jgi:hypothetical protein